MIEIITIHLMPKSMNYSHNISLFYSTKATTHDDPPKKALFSVFAQKFHQTPLL